MSDTQISLSRLSIGDLGHAERALVLAIRALADPADCRGWVMWDFGRLFPGPEGPVRAIAALRSFLRLLAAGARVAPRIHDFEAHEVAADELALLALCAAIQAGTDTHAEALLAWLLPPPARPAARGFVTALARMMAESGARLPARRSRPLGPAQKGSPAPPLVRVGPVDADTHVSDQRHA